MNEAQVPKPKKSVALSGVPAGSTALCTVGRSGNDLHYRGYDILDVAETCEFEEIAHLLVHGKLPNRAELLAYKTKLKALRGLPAALRAALETLPAASHPMDVMRSGVSVLGCVLPEKDDHNIPGARDVADRLMASLGSMLLYWFHFTQSGRRIEVETDDDSIGGHFLHLLHGVAPRASWVKAMHTSLILYAEHEFNASTFAGRVVAGTGSDMFSAITGAIVLAIVTQSPHRRIAARLKNSTLAAATSLLLVVFSIMVPVMFFMLNAGYRILGVVRQIQSGAAEQYLRQFIGRYPRISTLFHYTIDNVDINQAIEKSAGERTEDVDR